jgi:hypothetical protein
MEGRSNLEFNSQIKAATDRDRAPYVITDIQFTSVQFQKELELFPKSYRFYFVPVI